MYVDHMYLGRMWALEGSFGAPLDWPSGSANRGFSILLCANRLNLLFSCCDLVLFQLNWSYIIPLDGILISDNCLFIGNCRVCNWPGSYGNLFLRLFDYDFISNLFNNVLIYNIYLFPYLGKSSHSRDTICRLHLSCFWSGMF